MDRCIDAAGRGGADGNPGDLAQDAQQHALFNELSRINNELANLQRELVATNRSLDRLNEQKNEMLGMAAHDLRGPLGAVLAYCDFLAGEGPLNPQQQQFVGMIRQASESMLRLVEAFLDLAAIEAGRLRLDVRPVELGALVTTNARRNQVLAARQGVRVEAVPPATPLVVQADPGKLEQVLDNLVGNAVKHSPRGAPVRVVLEAHADGARISVIDAGVGMAPDHLARLFQPFTREARRGLRGESAHGLGLAIVQKIVQAHGGRVEVESTPGQGSCFRVMLPGQGRMAGTGPSSASPACRDTRSTPAVA